MTDAQIEKIARAYCVKLGLDPDERWIPDSKPMWQHVLRPVREAIAMREAIAEVLGEKGVG